MFFRDASYCYKPISYYYGITHLDLRQAAPYNNDIITVPRHISNMLFFYSWSNVKN